MVGSFFLSHLLVFFFHKAHLKERRLHAEAALLLDQYTNVSVCQLLLNLVSFSFYIVFKGA